MGQLFFGSERSNFEMHYSYSKIQGRGQDEDELLPSYGALLEIDGFWTQINYFEHFLIAWEFSVNVTLVRNGKTKRNES